MSNSGVELRERFWRSQILDVERYPKITFKSKRVEDVEQDEMTVSGGFLVGDTLDVLVEVQAVKQG
jgi:polyisoprenoid-binding protein YceI